MREIKYILLVLVISLLIVLPSAAYMSYDIIASAGGPAFELHRSTMYLNFSVGGSVKGTGNFSRYSNIKNFVGVEAKEQTSATKKSTLDYTDQVLLKSREGPVIVTVNLESVNITNETQLNPLVEIAEAGDIQIDEYWPVLFANFKKISYLGPGISTRERYVNNGDTVITAIDSWKLNKQSLYQASTNRSHWDVRLTKTEARVIRASNKTSLYMMGLASTGSLTHLDITRRDDSGDTSSRITQDYSGEQTMNLKIKMGEIFIFNSTDLGWLDCCSGGYLEMNPIERKYLSADCIFNCTSGDYITGKSASKEDFEKPN